MKILTSRMHDLVCMALGENSMRIKCHIYKVDELNSVLMCTRKTAKLHVAMAIAHVQLVQKNCSIYNIVQLQRPHALGVILTIYPSISHSHTQHFQSHACCFFLHIWKIYYHSQLYIT